jgi:nitroreductase
VIVPCLEGATPTRTAGSSIYPAVQNMLLAARALGLGATLTTLYLNFEKEVETAFGLPADAYLRDFADRVSNGAFRSGPACPSH